LVIPTKQEFLKLLAACDADERPLMVILTHTLPRIDEILRLTWQDVSFERGTLKLWTRKNREGEWTERTIGTNAELKAMLLSLWNRRRQVKWVFFNQREQTRYSRRPKFMRRICKRAGVRHYTFHCIRHFIATYLQYIEKVPAGVLSEILGHESKRTTEIYLHSVDKVQREALRRLEGVFDACGRMLALSPGMGGKGQESAD
jgi:integrase